MAFTNIGPLSLQFIPKFLAQSKLRETELKQALNDMPVFVNDNERWLAFRNIVSTIQEKLKDHVRSGSDLATSDGVSAIGVTPHVTRMYKTYSAGIREVRWCLECTVEECHVLEHEEHTHQRRQIA